MGKGTAVGAVFCGGALRRSRVRGGARQRGQRVRERSEGLRGISRRVGGASVASRRWPRSHARAPRFPSAYWQEEEDGSALGGLGRYSGGLAPLVAAQVRPGKLSLSSVF